MAIKGVSIVYVVAGTLILYSGIKGASLASTAKAVLSGNLTLSQDQPIDVSAAAPADSKNAGSADVTNIPNGAAKSMVTFMLAQRGKRYSQANRFGPDSYDCSGLIWVAATHA